MTVGGKVALGDNLVVVERLLGHPGLGGVGEGSAPPRLVEQVLAADARVLQLLGAREDLGVGGGVLGQLGVPDKRLELLGGAAHVLDVEPPPLICG